MRTIKLLKCCFGVAALSLGLSACMDMDRSEQQPGVDAHYYEKMNSQHQQTAVKTTKPVQKTYASKDPTQAATPGPARKAAPQIPVIQ
jgi:hypothetical protein